MKSESPAEGVTAWIDIETTGLDPFSEIPLEIALVITDRDLNPILEKDWMIEWSSPIVDRYRQNAAPEVEEMHTANGLWDRLKNNTDGRHFDTVDYEIAALLRDAAGGEPLLLAGNSVEFDRRFINVYFPHTRLRLHYQSMDMSSVAHFLGLRGLDYPLMPKDHPHTALGDLRESIAQARHYRDLLPPFRQMDDRVDAGARALHGLSVKTFPEVETDGVDVSWAAQPQEYQLETRRDAQAVVEAVFQR